MRTEPAARSRREFFGWIVAASLLPALSALVIASVLAVTTSLAWSAVPAHALVGAAAGLLAAVAALLVAQAGRAQRFRRATYTATGSALFLLLLATGIGTWIARRSWGRNLTSAIVLDFLPQLGELATLLEWRAPVLVAGWILASTVAAWLWARQLARRDAALDPRSRRRVALVVLAVAAIGAGGLRAGGDAIGSHLALDPLLGIFRAGERPDLPPTAARIDAWVRDEELRRTFDAGTPRRKHLILILADGIRPDHLSVLGYERETTPFLDRLSRDPGWAVVGRAYSAATESLGGIGSIVAGRSTRTMSARSYGIVEFLARHGYRTHLLLNGEHDWYELRSIYGSKTTTYRDIRNRSPQIALHDDRQIVQWARELPPADDTPDFLMLFLMATHQTAPLAAEDSHFTRAAGGASVPFFFAPSTPEQWALLVDRYDDQVRAMDRRIEETWRVLEQKGYLEDCLVIFSSDHGQMLGEHGAYGHGRNVEEEGVRIPLMLWTDGALPPVARDRIAWTPDIAPTLAEAAGLKPLPSWEGISLFSPAPRSALWIDSVQFTNFASAALLEKSGHLWKLEQKLDAEGVIVSEAVYDLTTDPGETTDRIGEVPEGTLHELRSLASGRTGSQASSAR